jgi:hypothetical protein
MLLAARPPTRPEVLMSKLTLVLVALVASALSGCTFKTAGPPREANYDYSEYESYDQPHAQPVSWASGRRSLRQAQGEGSIQADASAAK